MPEYFVTLITYIESGNEEKKVLFRTNNKVDREYAEKLMKSFAKQGKPYERIVEFRDVTEEYK
jgi:hypothetical protein